MNELLVCPVRNRPLAGSLRVVKGSLSVKCKFCGGIHLISRNTLDGLWDKLEGQSVYLRLQETPLPTLQ